VAVDSGVLKSAWASIQMAPHPLWSKPARTPRHESHEPVTISGIRPAEWAPATTAAKRLLTAADDEAVSRVTLTVDGAKHPIDQVTKQLHKLVNVLKIRDLEPEDSVARELALFKIACDSGSRGEVLQLTEIFRGKVVDAGRRSVVVEITGADDKIESFEQLVRPFGLIEMARTGEIAISRGRGET